MIYIITGTSSGVGKALADFYLKKGNKVIGISRSNVIEHKNFTHIKCDLADREQIHNLRLLKRIKKEDYPIRLINNAGVIGEIKRINELTLSHYADLAMVNIVAPQYLCSYVLQTFGLDNVDMIINLSSGAGERPVSAWAAYCASKSALNIFAETLALELKELQAKTKVFNLAPGVVDTRMQQTIRASKKKDFSRHQDFVDLKENEELRTPIEVAKLFDEFIENPPSEEEGIIHRL